MYSIGITYGVLGTFGSNKGSIYTDDEDDGNANYCYVETYDEYNGRSTYKGYPESVANIMDATSNTRLHLSKVN